MHNHSHDSLDDEHDHHHGPGHNHSDGHEHMHSHVHTDPQKERRDRLKALASSFIEGFRKADDKPAFLELSHIPSKRTGSDGLTMHLIETDISSKWQLGTASPAFGSRELVYLPYPAAMVQERETMIFTYVSLTERSDYELLDLLDELHTKKHKDT